MDLVARTRLEIIVEAPLLRRVEALLGDAGVKGWSVFEGAAGSGRHGGWRAEGLHAADRKVMVVALTTRDHADAALEQLRGLFTDYPGVVSVGDVQVMRGDRF
jgi:hypothetical protein